MSTVNSQNSDGAGEKVHRLVQTSIIVFNISMVGVSVLLAFSDDGNIQVRIGIAVLAWLIYSASLTTGAFLGFLFGLPRARLAEEATAGSQLAETQAGKAAPLTTRFLTNSNLIKVSDWLTTIIIGLGLVNLSQLPGAVGLVANSLAAPLGNNASSGTAGAALLISSLFAGFGAGYLWTTIRVKELFEEAERPQQ